MAHGDDFAVCKFVFDYQSVFLGLNFHEDVFVDVVDDFVASVVVHFVVVDYIVSAIAADFAGVVFRHTLGVAAFSSPYWIHIPQLAHFHILSVVAELSSSPLY